MAKQSGIAANFYIGGYDISGDVSAINQISSPQATKDVTAIDKSAVERLVLLRDGMVSVSGWFDTAAGQEHPALNGAPTTDLLATATIGTALGNPAVCIWGKQVTYDLDRAADGSLATKATVQGDAFGLEWGQLLTTGKQTFTGGANGTGVDLGNNGLAAVSITSNSVANPTSVYAPGHGLATGDSVTIAGVTGSTPSINGDWPVIYVDANHFTVPVNVTVGGSGGTAQKTSTDYGGASYLQCFSLTGTSATAKVQHSADNGSADAWADVTGLSHTPVTGRIVGERVATTTTAIIKRYARIVVSGTFNPAALCLVLVRYQVAQA